MEYRKVCDRCKLLKFDVQKRYVGEQYNKSFANNGNANLCFNCRDELGAW